MNTSAAIPRHWIGVAARAHVRRGVAGGFCQLGHGKHAPVKRLRPGDLIASYAPREEMAEGEPIQAFAAAACDDASRMPRPPERRAARP